MTGRRIRSGIALLAVIGLVGGGYAAYAASGDDASYRTAVATVGDVEQTLALAGTVEPSGRADLQFSTSGTVAAVPVAEGDRVKAGQVLARLDRTSLTTAVSTAHAQLTSAQAQLETDEAAQANTVSSASDTSSSDVSEPSVQPSQQATPSSHPTSQASPSTKPTQQPTPSSKPDPVLAQLAKQQKAVTTAQSAATAAITVAKTALTAQTTACESAYAEPSVDPTSDPSASPSETPTEAADLTDEVCTTALTAVQTAQDDVATAQDDLQGALSDLADTLTAAIKKLGSSSSSSSSPSTSSSTGTQSGTGTAQQTTPTPTLTPTQSETKTPTQTSSSTAQGQSQGQGQGQGQTVTAATLARDQASIDQARADLVAAHQSLRAATVRAPYAGRVASITAVVGASVSAGDAAATVIAPGTTTAELAVTDTQVREVKLGQEADVTPAGAAAALAGKVTAIGAVPDTSSGSTTYPVTVTLDQRDLDLPSGVTASVAVVVGTAKGVVTVPASAVRSGSVTVLAGDTAGRTRVTTGVVGTSLIEVTDGLTAGDRVVLADLSAAPPTSDSTTIGPTGGFGQGGLGGGSGGPGGGQRSFNR